MWAFFFFVPLGLFDISGRCALVAERSRSVEHSFLQKNPAFRLRSMNGIFHVRLLSVAEASRSVLCHPFGIYHYCRVLPRAHTRVCVVFHPFRVDLIDVAAVVLEGRYIYRQGCNPLIKSTSKQNPKGVE